MDQATPGITAQSPPRAHIDKEVYDLDVGSGQPNGATAIKGSFVQRLTVLRDLSSDRSNPGRFLSMNTLLLVRKDRSEHTYCASVVTPVAVQSSYVGNG